MCWVESYPPDSGFSRRARHTKFRLVARSLFAIRSNSNAGRSAIEGNGSLLDLYIRNPSEQKTSYRLKYSDP